MNTKIKELTENIYNEGVSKARKEAEEILASARTEAEQTVAGAKDKAQTMIAEAKAEAEKINTSLKAELQAISEQVIEITRQKVGGLVTEKASQSLAGQVASDPELIKEMVLEIARNWLSGNGQGEKLDVLVPEAMAGKLNPLFQTAISETMKSQLVVKPVSGLKQGFQIVNDASGFKVSFTDEDFKTFFASLMKPKVREFLFNTEK